MCTVRRLLGLVALTLMLALSGCGLAPMTQHAAGADNRKESSAKAPIDIPVQTAAGGTTPTRLLIPAIGVNTLIESVGIQSNGDMATPTQYPWEDVGWYNIGPYPGEHGSAVIDGHLDRPGGYPAVFWRLRYLHIGDTVLVLMSTRAMLHFRITRIALYPPQAAPLQDIFGNSGGTYLNLITCAGDWIPSQHQTALRLVVYTSLA